MFFHFQLKCHPYWPSGDENEDELIFEDVKLKVALVEEEDFEYYSVRELNLENIEVSRHVELRLCSILSLTDLTMSC